MTFTLPGEAPTETRLLVDTGGSGSLFLNESFLERSGISFAGSVLATNAMLTVRGTEPGKDVVLERVVFAGFEFTPVYAQVKKLSDRYHGLIGSEFLRRGTVFFLQRDNLIYFLPNESMRDPFPRPTLPSPVGFGINAHGPEFRVYQIAFLLPDSPAEQAGLLVGDVIVRINGTPAERWDLPSLRSHLRQLVGEVELGILRDGEEITVRLLVPKTD